MDVQHPVIQLCIAGTQAEYAGRWDEAAALYRQAWDAAADDYGACIAAHYLARLQARPADRLAWNLEALRRAEAVADGRVAPFFPSLYLSLGQAYEQVGDGEMAAHYYWKAARLGVDHYEGYGGEADG